MDYVEAPADAVEGPIAGVALAKFAAELRAWRKHLGWTQAELGIKINYSAQLVSGIERCDRSPSLAFAKACDREMKLPGTFVRLHADIEGETYPPWFYPVIAFENKAVRIHEWEMRGVPGLLQTEAYARAVIRAGKPDDADDAVERAVSARLERQEVLTGDDAPKIWEVLHEGALRQLIGGPAVMAEQLDKLIELAGRPGITIQILPFTAHDNAGTEGPIMVFDFPDDPTVCYTECHNGGRVVEAQSETADLMMIINMVRASALSPRDSIALMRKIRREIDDR
jgi:transcriptional regulator with XRE-family HTH domain